MAQTQVIGPTVWSPCGAHVNASGRCIEAPEGAEQIDRARLEALGSWKYGSRTEESELPVVRIRRFAVNSIAVLIHGVAGHIADRRTDAESISPTKRLRGECNGERLVVARADRGRPKGASRRVRDNHIALIKCARVDFLVESHSDAGDRGSSCT